MIPTSLNIDGIMLRKLRKIDADTIAHYITPDIVRYTQNIPYPYSVDEGKKFVSKSMQDWRLGKGYVFGIVQNSELIGICSISSIDKENKHGELVYWLGKKFWGKGIMTRAAARVLRFGFEDGGLHKIMVSHFEENIASQRVIEKLGFVPEGKERDAIYRFGRWHTLYRYGLLEEEYQAKKSVT